MRVPGEVVEGGVIDAIGAAGADVGCGHAGMLQEGREVRTGAEIADVHFFALDGRRVGAAMLVAGGGFETPLLEDGSIDGAGNGAGDVANKLLERRHGGSGKIRTRDGNIDIEIGHGAVESAALLLDPFRGADEALFFSVPTAEEDGALGPPALAQQRADAVHGLEHGGGAARWDPPRRRPRRRDDCRQSPRHPDPASP